MSPEESIIRSTGVSLGIKTSGSSSQLNAKHTWNILACGDFGFTSAKPEKIAASSMNDFLETHEVKICGSVTENLPENIKPFFVKYPVRSVKDFSKDSIIDKIPALKSLTGAIDLIDKLLSGKISAENAVAILDKLELPPTIYGAILAKIEQNPSGSTTLNSGTVDSILSMIDIGDEPTPAPTATDNFISTISADSQITNSEQALQLIRENCTSTLSALYKTVVSQPFFKNCQTSWNALKKLLKNLGRNRDINLLLASSSVESSGEKLSQFISTCGDENSVPDIIIWDYPLTLSTSSVTEIKSVCEIAERYKSIVIGSLSPSTELQPMLFKADHLGDIFGQPEYIPYKRLRKEPASRCLCIGMPAAELSVSESNQPLLIGAAWVLAEQWVESILSKSMPFAFSLLENVHEFGLSEIHEHIAREAEEFGFSVLRAHPRGISSDPRVILEIDSSEAFSNLSFNLIVNRTARLAAEWVSEYGK
ncbi:MAG: hypothetical protein GX640_22580 [Fibrobacter sp.]|nr:hypothetical protein [Fibrobacter sp.]